MVVRRFFLFLRSLIFLLAIPPAVPSIGQELPEFKHHVKVRITADENVLGPVKSHISRALRSLGDVELVDGDHSWIIEITTIGPGIFVLVLKKFNDQNMLKKPLSDDLYHVKGRWFGRFSKKTLAEVCSKIATRFNQECLENERRTNRIFWDSLGKKPDRK